VKNATKENYNKIYIYRAENYNDDNPRYNLGIFLLVLSYSTVHNFGFGVSKSQLFKLIIFMYGQ